MSNPRLPNGPKPEFRSQILSDRQVVLLQHYANGLEMKQVADAASTTEDALKQQFVIIRAKLGAVTSAHAVAIGIRRFLID